MKAAQEATRLRYQCLKESRSFVFETVFSSPEKLDFLRKAKDVGFFIRSFYVCTETPEINVLRIAQRYSANTNYRTEKSLSVSENTERLL